MLVGSPTWFCIASYKAKKFTYPSTVYSSIEGRTLKISDTIIIIEMILYIGNFSRREIFAKMKFGRCVKFSPSPVFAISRIINGNVL